ncbi:MAG: hypothetical protein AAF620_19435 [Bacteroidota bacterium]
MQEQIEYISNFGLYNFISIWLLRAFWLTILILTLNHFSENPSGLSILSAIVLYLLFRITSEQFVIYKNAVLIRRRFCLDLIPASTIIQKNEIQNITISGHRNLKNNIVQLLLPFGVSFRNKVGIKLQNGSLKTLKTNIFIDELKLFKKNFEESL